MLTSNLVSFLAKCPYLMGNRYIYWHRNIVINEFIIMLLLLLLLSGTPFQFQAPPLTVASEGQGTTQFILLLQNIGYWGPFPVYLR